MGMSPRVSQPPCPACLEALEPRLLLSADLLITEFMADNENGIQDYWGHERDWIEIHNPTAEDVDLAGWKLRDTGNEWTFPSATLKAGTYLLVFASDEDTVAPNGELHANFRLKGDGEYLGLLDPAGGVVHEYAPQYPPQDEDMSYGVQYQQHGMATFVDQGYGARYVVPRDGGAGLSWIESSFTATGWSTGLTGLGFGVGGPGESVTLVDSGSRWRYLDNGSNQGTAWRQRTFSDTSWAAGDAQLGYGDGDEATTVGFGGDLDHKYITTYFRHHFRLEDAWRYSSLTLRLLRDDGAVVYLNGQELRRSNMPSGSIGYTTEALEGVGGGEEYRWFEYIEDLAARPGLLVEGDNVLAVEVHQIHDHSTDISFDLELIAETTASELLETNVEAEMRNVNASCYLRMPFLVAEPSEYTKLTLQMAYEDGYVAYLNGELVAQPNAPSAPQWNSSALADRPVEEALHFETVDLSDRLELLVSGQNILAIHALNDSASDGSFLIAPRLTASAATTIEEYYFPDPTPREPNVTGVLGVVGDTHFSVHRGLFTEPFTLEITTDTPGAQIRYTTKGEEPTATTGLVYNAQTGIYIDETTTLRAAAYRTGWVATNVDTQTYLFLDDVIRQSPNGERPGADWPNPGTVNSQLISYGMDPDIVDSSTYRATLKDDLMAIPSISLVTDLDHLFHPTTGIFVNAGRDGRAWERPASAELIYPPDAAGAGFPDGADEGFQIDAGLRIRGGYSRSGNNPKHAFRLFFREEYGDTKLRYPLFGEEGTDEFDCVDLRTSQNYSWAFGGPNNNTMVREVSSRDIQGDTGSAYTRSRYYHLYINGQYWGIYQTQERSEAAYAASYFGSDKEDFDVIHQSDSRRIFATDGNTDAYYRLRQIALSGFASSANYYRAQGLNTDGTRNRAYEVLLDADNLIDYMIDTFYVADNDGPGSHFTRPSPNNYWAMYNRQNPHGFQFFAHDMEHSYGLGTSRGGTYDINNLVTPLLTSTSGSLAYFNAHWLHQEVMKNREYALRFADRVYEHLFNDGILTPDAALARINARAAQIDRAIVAESARWGDQKSSSPRTRNHWLTDVNEVRSWIASRVPIVISQLRAVGWYLSLIHI